MENLVLYSTRDIQNKATTRKIIRLIRRGNSPHAIFNRKTLSQAQFFSTSLIANECRARCQNERVEEADRRAIAAEKQTSQMRLGDCKGIKGMEGVVCTTECVRQSE